MDVIDYGCGYISASMCVLNKHLIIKLLKAFIFLSSFIQLFKFMVTLLTIKIRNTLSQR